MTRTRLRRFTLSDFANMRVLESDYEIMRFTSARMAQTEEQSRARLDRSIQDPAVWAGELVDATFVGWFMLKPQSNGDLELGFMIVPSQQGKGLTTEIARTLITEARIENPNARIVACTTPDNTRSMRVLEKLGFLPTGQSPEGLNLFALPL